MTSTLTNAHLVLVLTVAVQTALTHLPALVMMVGRVNCAIPISMNVNPIHVLMVCASMESRLLNVFVMGDGKVNSVMLVLPSALPINVH